MGIDVTSGGSLHAVMFSHGKESGPWGSKISAMAEVVRGLGIVVESVDYRGMDDPQARVAKLEAAAARRGGPLVLVGSSMGGYVSAAAAAVVRPRGLFLLAPAFYMPGFDEHTTPRRIACPTAIVHGWRDTVVPVDHSIRWAREHRAALHVLDAEHRLDDQIGTICELLKSFISAV
jgi:alpha-beta hydrolase superfamily lysophospholipase